MSPSKGNSTQAFVLELIAGGVSGVVTKTSTAPLERVKILLQLQGMEANKKVKPDPVSGVAIPKTQLKYRGIWHTLITVYREEGVRGYFKGNGANVVRVIPVYALKFAFNDTFKNLFRTSTKSKLSFAELMMSGTLAGLFQQCVTYPLETVRTRLTMGALSTHQFNGIAHALLITVQHEGFRAIHPTTRTQDEGR